MGIGQGDFCRIFPVDEKQRNLTQQRLGSRIGDLAFELDHLRQAIDRTVGMVYPQRTNNKIKSRGGDARSIEQRFLGAALTRIVIKHFGSPPLHLARYPIGCCAEITLVGFEYVLNEGYKYSPSFRQLLGFMEEGGICKIIWGSLRGLYFQTALQIGAFYVDIANDTVDPFKPRVDWSLLESSGFKNIDTIGEFAKVKSIYHAVDLYWNDFIPAIFPYCPLIEISISRHTISVVIIKDIINVAINGPLESVFGDFGTGTAVKCASNSLISSLALSLTGSESNMKRLTLSRLDQGEMNRMLRTQVAATPAERDQAAQKCQTIARFFNLAWLKSPPFDKIDLGSEHMPAARLSTGPVDMK